MSSLSHTNAQHSGSIPARAGIGLRAAHHDAILVDAPPVGWLEVHSENYFVAGGAQLDYLLQARARYPVSLHGVGLSIGSTDELNREHLHQLGRLIEVSEPGLVSEHLSWSSAGGVFLNDLLPLPYTEEALAHMVSRVHAVQDFLGRQILIENVSSYLTYTHSHLSEWEFISALAAASGCGLLVDINNIYVSSRNHGFDPRTYLAALPREAVAEIHLAGHSINHYGQRPIWIDTHSRPVCDDVWELYAFALECFGPVPTLIEWDQELPPLSTLVAEAAKADALMEHTHAIAA